MIWVEFTGPFDWDPPERKGRTTFHFNGGETRLLRALCANAAVAAGAAKEVAKPKTVEPDMISLHPLLGPMQGDPADPAEASADEGGSTEPPPADAAGE